MALASRVNRTGSITKYSHSPRNYCRHGNLFCVFQNSVPADYGPGLSISFFKTENAVHYISTFTLASDVKQYYVPGTVGLFRLKHHQILSAADKWKHRITLYRNGDLTLAGEKPLDFGKEFVICYYHFVHKLGKFSNIP